MLDDPQKIANRARDKAILDAHSQHAWTLAFVVWIAGAALIYTIHHWIGEVRDRDVRWWLDAGLYVVAFGYVAALGPLHQWFFLRLTKPNPCT